MTITTPVPTVGQELPARSWRTGLENWNRYAAVNDEFVPIHMDDVAGQAAGYQGAFGMGNLQWSYLHNLLRDWLAGFEESQGRILKLECSFRAPNLKGSTVTARGHVTAVDRTAEHVRVTVEVWTEDESGQKLAPGSAVLELGVPADRKDEA